MYVYVTVKINNELSWKFLTFFFFFALKAVLSCHSASPANFFRIHFLLYELLCKCEKSVRLIVF